MPKPLPLILIAAKNELSMADPWLTFLHVVMPNSDNLWYVNNLDNVIWDSQEYVAAPFQLGVQRFSNTGSLPSLDLKISNVLRMLQPYIDALDGAVGAVITLSIVSYANLTADHSELTVEFEVMHSSCNDIWVTFSLGSSNLMLQRFPLFRYFANSCNWTKHFKGAECKYSGAETTCSGTLDDCELRSNSTNFGGHPGLNNNGLRIVR